MLLFLCLCLFLLKQWLSAAVSIMQGQDKCCSSAGAGTAALRKVPEWVAALQIPVCPGKRGSSRMVTWLSSL